MDFKLLDFVQQWQVWCWDGPLGCQDWRQGEHTSRASSANAQEPQVLSFFKITFKKAFKCTCVQATIYFQITPTPTPSLTRSYDANIKAANYKQGRPLHLRGHHMWDGQAWDIPFWSSWRWMMMIHTLWPSSLATVMRWLSMTFSSTMAGIWWWVETFWCGAPYGHPHGYTTIAPSTKLTRARKRAIKNELSSLIIELPFTSRETWMLPQAETLCTLRYHQDCHGEDT